MVGIGLKACDILILFIYLLTEMTKHSHMVALSLFLSLSLSLSLSLYVYIYILNRVLPWVYYILHWFNTNFFPVELSSYETHFQVQC